MNNNYLKIISDYLKEQTGIVVAYLHGSYAGGVERAESDIDIAMLFSQKPDFTTISRLQIELSEIVNKEVDISVLNDASPIFARQVLEKGIELFCGNERQKHEFVIKVLNEYDDLKYSRRHIEKNILKGRIFAG